MGMKLCVPRRQAFSLKRVFAWVKWILKCLFIFFLFCFRLVHFSVFIPNIKYCICVRACMLIHIVIYFHKVFMFKLNGRVNCWKSANLKQVEFVSFFIFRKGFVQKTNEKQLWQQKHMHITIAEKRKKHKQKCVYCLWIKTSSVFFVVFYFSQSLCNNITFAMAEYHSDDIFIIT